MVYLLLGEDLKSKDARIVQIRSKFFTDLQAFNFDLESLDGSGLAADTLKKSPDHFACCVAEALSRGAQCA